MYSIKRILIVTQFIFLILSSAISAQAAGEVDTSFNIKLVDVDYVFYSESIERTSVKRVAVQPDGKILAVGIFNVVNDSVRDNLVRFNADGTLDTGFNLPALARFSGGSELLNITALALQADGKILIGGNFITTGAVRRVYLARLNADGSLDSSFNANQTGESINGPVFDIDISADGKITVCGDFSVGVRQKVVRLLSDGTLDTSFNPQINTANLSGAYDVLVQPDGKTLVSLGYSSGNSMMYRLNVDGSVDFSHTINGNSRLVNRIVVQSDGKIILGGSFNMIDGFPIQQGLARLNADGTYDTTFNFGNSGASSVSDVELLGNGKILIGGSFGAYNGVERQYVAIINSDGSLDNSFNYTAGRVLGAYDLAVQADGKIVVATYADFSQGVLVPPIARLNADATLDSSLQPFMGSAGIVHKVLVQPDGKVLIGGFYNHVNSVFRRNLARFNQNGTPDSSFTGNIFFSAVTNYVAELDLQPDGKILTAGYITNGERINADGTHDVTLSNSSNPPSIRYLPGGKLLKVSGEIARYSENGFFEAQTVRFNFDGVAYKAAIQADGKIIIVGTFTQINFSADRGRIARLNTDGTFDAAFNPPGGANARINDVLLQADGKIIIGGQFTSVNGNSNYKYLARLNPDGSIDTSFNPILNGEVICLKIQPDGKILFGGRMTTVNGIPRNSMARVNPNGTLDASLNLGVGADGLIRSIDLQADGKIIIGGEFRRVNGAERLGVARLLNAAVPQRQLFDYDGDGRADVSVFRPSENKWYVLRSSDGVVMQQVFAIAGDVPVPSDYDGDGKTDIAIYRPSSADWWSLSSINGNQNYAHWGESGVIARPSDFDGDGKSDYIFYLPANSTWYRFGSSVGASYVTFGLAGDKPVTGDFDGDGKSDVAIYRPSTGDWWWKSSIDGVQRATHWGISTDIPAPADYDGDGKTDFAVYRPSNGTWYIYNSSTNSSTIMNFGIAEDKPVAADYDGDGKADIAVFRPSTGVWYLMRTTAGFTAQQFGISSDIPTPNAFVP
jgi:uncharacterized delta-60 repeat protein